MSYLQEEEEDVYINRKIIRKLSPRIYNNMEIKFYVRLKFDITLYPNQVDICDSQIIIVDFFREFSISIHKIDLNGVKINNLDNINNIRVLHSSFQGRINFHIFNYSNTVQFIPHGTILAQMMFIPCYGVPEKKINNKIKKIKYM